MRKSIWTFVLFVAFTTPYIELHGQPSVERRVSLSLSAFLAAGAIWPHFEYCIDGRHSDVEWEPGRPDPAWIPRFTEALMGVDAEASFGISF